MFLVLDGLCVSGKVVPKNMRTHHQRQYITLTLNPYLILILHASGSF